jgi:Transposase DDE domain group 1
VKRIGLYPRVQADTRGAGVVSQAGGVALVETIRAAGLDRALSVALAWWRKPVAIHDPAKVITDVAVALALGGDCLADVALLRVEPAVFGLVASDSTVSRTIDTLAADAARVLAAIDAARASARARVWRLAGEHAPDHAISADTPLIIDVDATLITAHSEKEHAAPTFKRGFGFHPIWTFADHGGEGTGEPLSFLLRKGNAGSNTAADHIAVVKAALAQLPGHKSGTRPGRKVLVRTDAAGCTHEFLNWLVGQRLSYSVGFTLPDSFTATLALIPDEAWSRPTTPAVRSVTGPGSPRSPTCSSCAPGRRACG